MRSPDSLGNYGHLPEAPSNTGWETNAVPVVCTVMSLRSLGIDTVCAVGKTVYTMPGGFCRKIPRISSKILRPDTVLQADSKSRTSRRRYHEEQIPSKSLPDGIDCLHCSASIHGDSSVQDRDAWRHQEGRPKASCHVGCIDTSAA